MSKAASIGDLLQQAVRLHQSQQLDAANKIYDAVLKIDRTNADALNLKGLIALQHGRADEALALFDRAVAILPSFAGAHTHRGNALAALGRRDDALAAYAQAIQVQPNNVDANFASARLLAARGDFVGAAERLRRALGAASGWTNDQRAETTNNLGDYLRQAKQYDEAIAVLRQALVLRPNDHVIGFNLATALHEARQMDEAEQIYLGLTRTHPDFVRAFVNLALVYRDQGRTDESIALLERVLLKHPDVYQAYSNIGAAFADKGWTMIGMMLHAHALSVKGKDAQTELDRTVSLLALGQFSGWAGYTHRFDVKEEGKVRRPTPPPVWEGENLTGKRVLIWTEQGLGDEILYGGMIPEILARAGTTIIECSQRLVPVFERSFPAAKVVPWSLPHIATTPPREIDFQIPAGNLGRHFRNSFAQFPQRLSFLKADPARVTAIKRAYAVRASGRQIVGVSWRSNNPFIGASKSANLTNFAPLLTAPNAMFVDLQYGDTAGELAAVRQKTGVDIFHDPEIDALADIDAFFAKVAAMDLVITTSSTTAHVAGSLGIPVWIILPPIKDALWYWFLRRTDSPWYPSATLYRSRKNNNVTAWEDDVVPRVASALKRWLEKQ